MNREGGGGLALLEGLHLAWVREADLPPGEGWLTPSEREVLAGLKLPKRRTDWLLGRCAAKRAAGALLGGAPASEGAGPQVPADAAAVEILAGEDGRPRVRAAGFSAGGPRSLRISISHAGGVGFAAALDGDDPLGCDVEVVEPRSEAFVTDYLTEREAAAVRNAGPAHAAVAANLVWSAKESALKALGQGLRLDTRSVEVDVSEWPGSAPPGIGPEGRDAGDWAPLAVMGPGGVRFRGSWRLRDGLVWTVLSGG